MTTASECSGRGNHNNDSAPPLAIVAIRVDEQGGQIMIGSSLWFARKACQCQVKYACSERVRNVMQSASDGDTPRVLCHATEMML